MSGQNTEKAKIHAAVMRMIQDHFPGNTNIGLRKKIRQRLELGHRPQALVHTVAFSNPGVALDSLELIHKLHLEMKA